jgi:hypothetical protein
MRKLIYLLAVAASMTACVGERYAVTSTNYSGKKSDFDPQEKRVVIFNATIDVTARNVDTLNARLVKIVTNYKGYVVKISDKQSTVRVPAVHLENALSEISKSGRVKGISKTGMDVTEEFKDYTIRLENASKARDRYLELLAKAENVEATLKVEKELERLNGEIELLKGKLGRLQHLADYSTIEVNITQKHKLGILGHVFVGVYKGVKWLFVRD